MISNKKTGEIYENRKEAKLKMGHSNFNRALKGGHLTFLNTDENNNNNNNHSASYDRQKLQIQTQCLKRGI